VRPEIVACDLHPDYLSTRYALGRPEPVKVQVQHHHAHVVSAMAEHGLEGPVIGIAYDGTGYGTDGTAWGSEVLIADRSGFERLATFRGIKLAGGDLAIKRPWRIALALLDDAFDGDPPLDQLPLFRALPEADVRVVREMLARGVNTPIAHGMGRYFDGFGAIGLARPRSAYEGQIALEWNLAADPAEGHVYPYAIDRSRLPWTVDLRAALREAVYETIGAETPGTISARFHRTIAKATADVIRGIARHRGPLPVVLTGGCFQNALLVEWQIEALGAAARVYTHRDVPPGDGGIALGQAIVAASQWTGGREDGRTGGRG
jgi:hydrogenase maturation protein HypF